MILTKSRLIVIRGMNKVYTYEPTVLVSSITGKLKLLQQLIRLLANILIILSTLKYGGYVR